MPVTPDVVTVHRHLDDWIHKFMQRALHVSNFVGILSTLHEFYAYGAVFLVSHQMLHCLPRHEMTVRYPWTWKIAVVFEIPWPRLVS